MPIVEVDGLRFFYRLEGMEQKPVLVFAHSLGCDHGQWDPQMPELLRDFRILRCDMRGHGGSDAPEGEYSIEMLARDVLGIAEQLGIAQFAFCGLSIGGMIGQWLGANAPRQVTRLILANTSPKMANPQAMEDRRQTVLASGMDPVVEAVMGRFFHPRTRYASPYAATTERVLRGTDPIGYAGCCAAVRDLNQVELLGRIKMPVLVIGGEMDQSTPWEGHGDLIVSQIAGAKAVKLPTAHLSNIEEAQAFTSAVREFLG